MTDTLAASSDIVVSVDPSTAFKAFTEEMDLWWQRGPINFWADAGRVVEVRCEPGVGGRIMEILDDRESGDHLERARITAWEPGAHLAFASSLDDVLTEVKFEPVDGGTRVVVEHTVPVGGKDQGGTAWSRVVPIWFGAWVAQRDQVPHEQIDIARLSLGVYYARPAAAARWLADVFGFVAASDLPQGRDPLPHGGHGHPWIEFRIGNAILNVFPLEGERTGGVRTHIPWVYVDDLDAHFAHAKGRGADIVEEIRAYPGSTIYVADDLEGNRWTFSQARPTMR
ncbi:MAG TPA: VOC family protein [Acidimicrobiales bacterium]|nr:VOC family protein [Acidimicrobiales bacterium]